MMPDPILKLLQYHLSGQRCVNHTYEISRFHREPGMPGFQEALAYVEQECTRIGLEEINVHNYVMDGQNQFHWNWVTVPGWTPHRATLTMTKPYDVIVADISETPCALGLRSQRTPPEGLTAELIYVGHGTTHGHYAGKDVKGKFVLIDADGQFGSTAIDTATAEGVAGVLINGLIDKPPHLDRLTRADMVPHAWTTHWYLGAPVDHNRNTVTFSVSHRQALWLRGLLDQGPVVLTADVDVTFNTSAKMNVLSAVIRGVRRPEDEFGLSAHLDHPWPGSNDNASGCALLLEIAETLAVNIRRGQLAAPDRTLRFLFTTHMIGTAAWLHHNPNWAGRVLGGFNLDSVGEDQSQTRGPLRVARSANRNPTFINELVEDLVGSVPAETRVHLSHRKMPDLRWRAEIMPFTFGSDHYQMNDAAYAIPVLSIGHLLDNFYHTHQDSVDKTDPAEFEKSGWLVAGAAYITATAGPDTARREAHRVYAHSMQRLYRYYANAMTSTAGNERILGHIERMALRDAEAILSVLRLVKPEENEYGSIEGLCHRLIGQLQSEEHELLGRLDGLAKSTTGEVSPELQQVPTKLFVGPANTRDIKRTLLQVLPADRLRWFDDVYLEGLATHGVPHVLMAIDGQATVGEILDEVEFEHGLRPEPNVVLRFLDCLAEAGHLSLSGGPSRADH